MKKTEIKNLDLDLYYEKLENGLEVYIIPKENCNNVYATFSTKYGSNIIEFVPINEKKMIKVPLGIAHFLEHKLFEQKDGIDPFTFYSERGADANANTNQKKTTYLFSGSSFVIENLNFLLDYVQDPYFTDKNVDKEKGIITQEIKMYQDDPGTVIYETLMKNCFVNHPMKNSIIGTIDSINSITKEDLYKCYNTFYHPSNMFLVVTGNVNPNEIIECVKENQKKKNYKKEDKIKIKTYDEPNKVAKENETISLNISIPEIALGIKLKKNKNLYEQLLYTLTYLDCILGPTSDFIENLINEEIINYDLAIQFDSIDDYIVFFILGETKQPEVLLNKIKNELKNKKITEKEFLRKKKTLISSLIYMSDNIFSLNHAVMSDIIRYNEFNTNRYEDLQKLNYENFNKYIKSLDLNNICTLIADSKK